MRTTFKQKGTYPARTTGTKKRKAGNENYLFNREKTAGTWNKYKKALTKYNEAIRKSKKDTWRRHCAKVSSTLTSDKLQRILAKTNRKAISIGGYSKTRNGKMAELQSLRMQMKTAVAQLQRNLLTGQPEQTGQFQRQGK